MILNSMPKFDFLNRSIEKSVKLEGAKMFTYRWMAPNAGFMNLELFLKIGLVVNSTGWFWLMKLLGA